MLLVAGLRHTKSFADSCNKDYSKNFAIIIIIIIITWKRPNSKFLA